VQHLEKIPDSVLELFKPVAEELIASQGAVEALSAALAQISGNTTDIKVFSCFFLYSFFFFFFFLKSQIVFLTRYYSVY